MIASLQIALFVQRYPPALGGAESYAARLARYHAAQGDQVTVHTTNALSLEAFWSPESPRHPPGVSVEEGVTVHRHALRYFPGRRYFMKGLSLLPWSAAWQGWTLPCNPIAPSMLAAAHTKPARRLDVVHVMAFPYAFPILCGQRLAQRTGAALHLTPFLHLGNLADRHDRTRRAYLAPALVALLHAADRVFVQTELERQAVLAVGVAPQRVTLQGLGVACNDYVGGSRARAEQRWQLPAAPLRIGHLANLSAEKGTIDLLRALARSDLADCTAVLAGPSMPNFRRFWRQCPQLLRRRVRLLGPLPEAHLADFYAACDVFALPSRSDSYGLVLLEAWANGLPCVGYRAGGIAEVIRHEQDGLLVDCGDIDGLARQFSVLRESPQLRQHLGEAGRLRMHREHRWPDKLDLVRRYARAA